MKPIPREDVKMIIYTAECWSTIIKRTYKVIEKIMEDEDYKQELVIAGIEAYHKWMGTPGNSRENMTEYREGKKTLLSFIINAMKFQTGKIVQLADYDKRKIDSEFKLAIVENEKPDEEFLNRYIVVNTGSYEEQYDLVEMDYMIDRLPVSEKDKKILKAIIREAPASFLGKKHGIALKDLAKSTGYSAVSLSKSMKALSKKREVKEMVCA